MKNSKFNIQDFSIKIENNGINSYNQLDNDNIYTINEYLDFYKNNLDYSIQELEYTNDV